MPTTKNIRVIADFVLPVDKNVDIDSLCVRIIQAEDGWGFCAIFEDQTANARQLGYVAANNVVTIQEV